MASNRVSPRLHYRPADGWVGDVHPVFRAGKWHVFYLKVPLAPLRNGLARLHSALLVSDDLIHWTEKKITLDDTTRAWWAVANLAIGGKIYSFYNGPEGFDLATSLDGKQWTPDPHNPVVPYPDGQREIRDPFILRAGGTYHLIVAGRKRDVADFRKAGVYLHATSNDLVHWSSLVPLYDPGNIGVPECPDLFRLGDRYYLLGSWGVNRVGQARYRVAPTVTGPWKIPSSPDTLDSTEVMAPNTAADPHCRLFFGWVPTYVGQKDSAPFEWGGHLVFPRELYRDAEGSLYLRLPRAFLSLRRKSYPMHPAQFATRQGSATVQASSAMLSAGGVVEVPGTWDLCEVEAIFVLQANCPSASVTFRGHRPDAVGYQLTVDIEKQQMVLHRADSPDTPLAVTALRVVVNHPIHVRVFLDGEIVEAFVNDRYALAGRVAQSTHETRLGFATLRGTCTLNWFTVHTLKAVYPRPQLDTVDLTPSSLNSPQDDRSVRFARSGANVYTPFDPVLNFQAGFTLSCQVKVAPQTGGFKANLIAKGDGDGPAMGYHYGLNLTHGGGLELYYRTATGFEGLSSARKTVGGEGQWLHVVGVMDAPEKELRLYRDGKCIARKQVPHLPPLVQDNQGALRLGYAAGVPNADSFYGFMNAVRLWDGALTDAEVAACSTFPYNNPRPDQTVIDWDFEQTFLVGGRVVCRNRASRYPTLTGTLFDGAQLNVKR